MLREFLKAAPFFKMFTQYVNNFALSSERLSAAEGRPPVATFLKACELQRGCHGLQLRDFLIMPVQRIPRYRLLLETILKYTKEADPLHARLSENLRAMAAIADNINRDVHRMERRNKVLEVQSQFAEEFVTASRLFVKEGQLVKICRGGSKKLQFVLFNDVIVYGSETLRGKFGKQQYKLRRSIPLDRCFVAHNLPADGPMPHGFLVLSPHKSFALMAHDAAEAADWVAAFKGVLEDLAAATRPALPPVTPRGGGISSIGGGPSCGGGGGMNSVGPGGNNTGSSSGGGGGGGGSLVGAAAATAAAAGAAGGTAADQWRDAECALWLLGRDGKTVVHEEFVLPRAASIKLAFASMLEKAASRACFRRYLESVHAGENLAFWEVVGCYEELVATQTAAVAAAATSVTASLPSLPRHRAPAAVLPERIAMARAIADRFVREGSPEQVNLSAAMREEILKHVAANRFPPDLFTKGRHEVQSLMARDGFPRFRFSEHFSDMLRALGLEQLPCGLVEAEDIVFRGGSGGVGGGSSAGLSPLARSRERQ
ncbi:unnamed protein product, partial [Phaeothamnion confervicola]